MFKTLPNQKTLQIRIKRRELVDLLLALNEMSATEPGNKWSELHDKLREQLDAFDRKEGIE